MKKTVRTVFSLLNNLLILILISCLTYTSCVDTVKAVDLTKESVIQNKIAKNYSKKFCNAIGIGLSTESAARLAINENKNPKFNSSLWVDIAFSGEEAVKENDTQKLFELISMNIVNDCGPAIDLYSKEDIDNFTEYFLSLKEKS